MRHRLRSILIGIAFIAAGAIVVYAIHPFLLTKIGSAVIREDQPEPSDAIVLLNGMFPRDVLVAADLFHKKLAPQIIVTPERWPDGFSELRKRNVKIGDATEGQIAALVQMGVPQEAIITLNAVTESTRQEAKAFLAYRARHPDIRSIILIARRPQSRRAGRIFEKKLGKDVHVSVVTSPYDRIRSDNWWKDPWYLREVVGEIFTYCYQGLGALLGDPQDSSPGPHLSTERPAPLETF